MPQTIIQNIDRYCLKGVDFSSIEFMELLCCLDLGVLMTDHKGVLIFYNHVQATIDRMDPAQVLGKPITQVYEYDNDSSTCMRVLKHGKPIINYALSYRSENANVGNTIHSVFPLFINGKIFGTICFVKDYNILERSIPAFLSPGNNSRFAQGTRYTFASIIGSDPVFVDSVKAAKIAGNSPSPVMLYGETGTGKELFAQAIHNFYYGNEGRYVDINCAAIPENLIEGLLFGTVKGAYTGAVDRAGLFEQANQGTIFLDEINSMPLALQGKLLRAIQEKKVRRVGSLNSTSLEIKIISSLNQSPKSLIKSGAFRMDLFYRLGVIFIKLPALRDRRLDIEELGRHFLQKYNTQLGKSIENIDPELINFFWDYPWPGNIRELEHVIESAVNLAGNNETRLKLKHCYFANILEQEDIQESRPRILSLNPHPDNPSDNTEFFPKSNQSLPFIDRRNSYPETNSDLNLARAASSLEKDMILNALERSNGNMAGAAKLLGISRQLLGYKIAKQGLRPLLTALKHNK
ncbi:PAS modulated sigma54-dependent transcriptional regulator, Fis family [Desulfonema limicola]|uniref:PAS modulated sigma54-dependent transcriptional regulator, Fis family n=1 Tax=Desulfonema limicola TaxID=45656 RepID=A0A975GJB0_9BACT|nr:sigma 54-interacting transcriptional regulator [Desulfonema limicola]QTA83369.1 PAS modulated sigma54-dependent transcriptional regulator, Fis family [Desulfonema limicola]